MKKLELTGLLFIFLTMAQGQTKNSKWLENFLRQNASPLLTRVLDQPDTFKYQIIYTKIDRNIENLPKFTNYYLNVDKETYFYPASMVKLPTALTALEKINSLKTKELTSIRQCSPTAITAARPRCMPILRLLPGYPVSTSM
ncbi:hypothetical protein KRR40_16315 [Niabella defluvii]|nr:hypothetical protein KRR40_16315 [Niabella sp. I65]